MFAQRLTVPSQSRAPSVALCASVSHVQLLLSGLHQLPCLIRFSAAEGVLRWVQVNGRSIDPFHTVRVTSGTLQQRVWNRALDHQLPKHWIRHAVGPCANLWTLRQLIENRAALAISACWSLSIPRLIEFYVVVASVPEIPQPFHCASANSGTNRRLE